MEKQSVLKKRLDVTIMAERIIQENKYVIEQPTVQEIIDILTNVLLAETDVNTKIGDVLSSEDIDDIFKRKPQTEGINYCAKSN